MKQRQKRPLDLKKIEVVKLTHDRTSSLKGGGRTDPKSKLTPICTDTSYTCH